MHLEAKLLLHDRDVCALHIANEVGVHPQSIRRKHVIQPGFHWPAILSLEGCIDLVQEERDAPSAHDKLVNLELIGLRNPACWGDHHQYGYLRGNRFSLADINLFHHVLAAEKLLCMAELVRWRLAMTCKEPNLFLPLRGKLLDGAANVIFQRGSVLNNGESLLLVGIEEDKPHIGFLDFELILIHHLHLDRRNALLLGFPLHLLRSRIDKLELDISPGVRLVFVQFIEQEAAVGVIWRWKIIGEICTDRHTVVQGTDEHFARVGEGKHVVARNIKPSEYPDGNNIKNDHDQDNQSDTKPRLNFLRLCFHVRSHHFRRSSETVVRSREMPRSEAK